MIRAGIIVQLLNLPRNLLFQAVPAQFVSDFSLNESVSRLRAVCRSPYSFVGLFKQSAVGTVTARRAQLWRGTPFFRNSFKPCFSGRFAESNGRIVLDGQFGLQWFVKAFMCFWFGFCLLWTAGATFAVVVQPDAPGFLPFGGLAMILFGVVLVSAGKKMSQDDIGWLSDLMSNALKGRPTIDSEF